MRHVSFAALALLAAMPAAALETVEEIRACVRANLPQRSVVQQIRLVTEDRGGGTRELSARMYGMQVGEGRIGAMISVEAPQDLAGARYLLVDKNGRDDMYMFLPALGRTRRILGTMTQRPLWGTDFSYEDLKHLQNVILDGTVTRAGDAQDQGRPVYVLELEPAAGDESAYSRLRFFISRDHCLLLGGEFHDPAGLSKRFVGHADSAREVDGRWIATHYTMQDVRKQTRSHLHLDATEYDDNLSRSLFNPKTFQVAH